MNHPGHIDKCIDRDGRTNSATGAPFQLWACHEGENQDFAVSFDW